MGRFPSVAKIPRVVNPQVESERAFLKAAYLFLFALGLYLFDFPFWPYVTIFCVLLSFCPYDKIRSVGALNLIFWVVTGSLFAIPRNYIFAKLINYQELILNAKIGHEYAGAILAGALALFALIYFLLLIAFKKIKWLRQPLILTFATFLLLGFSIRVIEKNSIPQLLLIGAFLALSKTFWMVNYQLSEVDMLGDKPFWLHFGTLSPPWQAGWTGYSVVRGYGDYLGSLVTDAVALLKLQKNAVKLLFYALGLKTFAVFMQLFLSSAQFHLGKFDFNGLSYYCGTSLDVKSFIALKLSVPLSWAFLFSDSLYFLVSLAASTNAVVAVARICGFGIYRNVYKPYLATSFNGFLTSIYFYYIAILQRFLFYPLWGGTRFIRQRKIRIFLIFFLTIFVGGSINRMVRLTPEWIAKGPLEALALVTIRSPYLALLGLFSAGSALTPKIPERYLNWGTRSFLVTLYFVMYSVCYFFSSASLMVDGDRRVEIILHLLGQN